MSKLASAPYRTGHSKTWRKTKCFTESILWLSAPTETARPERLGLCSRTLTAAGLNYAGAAFIALNDDARTEFLAEVDRLTIGGLLLKPSRQTGC